MLSVVLYQSESECPLAFSWATHWLKELQRRASCVPGRHVFSLPVKQMSPTLSSNKINATSDLVWQYGQVSWVLQSAQLSTARGHTGQDPSDLTPHRHEHLGVIRDRAHVAECWQNNVLVFVWNRTEEKGWNFQSGSFLLLYLCFICLPAARPSSVPWVGVFSSLTNVVQIACGKWMGEHLDLGHTLFVVVALPQPFPLPFLSSLFCFSGSVKCKKSFLTSFQPGCWGLDPRGGASCLWHRK